MEPHVTLSLEQYHKFLNAETQLKEFKKAHTIVVSNALFSEYVIKTDDMAVKMVGEDLLKMQAERDELYTELNNLKEKLKQGDKPIGFNVEGLSFWQFLKLRKW